MPRSDATHSAMGMAARFAGIRSSRRLLLPLLALAATVSLAGQPMAAQEKPPAEIRIDYASYNPVSLVLKQKGWLEDEFKEDGVRITWLFSAGSNKAVEYISTGAGDFTSSAGAAALLARANKVPLTCVYIYSRPEWTALVVRKDSPITTVADLRGKKIAATKGTDPYIFLLRAQQEDVRVGALGGGDLLAPEVGDRRDRRVLAHHQGGPLRPGIDVDAGERHLVCPGEQGGRAGGGGEVAGACGDVLHRLVGPGAEQPGDPDAVLLELVLQPTLLLEHQADRVVRGIVDADLGGRLLLRRHGLPRQAHRRGERQQRQKQTPRRPDACETGGHSHGA